jgi:perosamine synthetase
MEKINEIISFIRKEFNSDGFIPLHEPRFIGNERKYVLDAIDSTFVSSVGAYVDKFEEMIKETSGAKYAIATVNGTSALHISLLLAGVKPGEEVITQAVTFVATSNAISYSNAQPVFIDVDLDTLGMSPDKLTDFLQKNSETKTSGCYNRLTGKRIAACLPMHTFGFPTRIDEIIDICDQYTIPVVEDAAESLGSYYKNKHTGSFGLTGAFSLNGNKTITSGGGGAIITNDPDLGKLAKHITTTAKTPHRWEYVHEVVGYNYRMPNLNAALACAQMEQLSTFIESKRELSNHYADFFNCINIPFVKEIKDARANYWLMTVILKDREEKEFFLKETNEQKVMTRPLWQLMNKLTMYENCLHGDLSNSEWLAERVVNIPSSVRC